MTTPQLSGPQLPGDLPGTLPGDQQVRELARLAGIPIAEDEVGEVANRFQSLILELDRLRDLDLSDIQPVVIFPDEGEL